MVKPDIDNYEWDFALYSRDLESYIKFQSSLISVLTEALEQFESVNGHGICDASQKQA